jgi:hypothetical protein
VVGASVYRAGVDWITARLAGSVAGSPATHSFKYALFYGRPGERLVLFDNERGKGDHKHILEVESPYEFRSPEKLIEDFQAAVHAVSEGKSR